MWEATLYRDLELAAEQQTDSFNDGRFPGYDESDQAYLRWLERKLIETRHARNLYLLVATIAIICEWLIWWLG